MVLLTAIYLGLSRGMWQKCTGIEANFKATLDISIGEVNESRLNVRFGVIIRKVTSLLTWILVPSVKNTEYHVALTNVEDGMEALERKNLPEGLGSHDISGVTPRLEPDGKDREGEKDGRELQCRVPRTRPRSQTLTSPSLPSQGSLVLMAGNAPPPTGAVDPRPNESSLGDKSETSAHYSGLLVQMQTPRGNEGLARYVCAEPFLTACSGKHLMDRIIFSIRDNTTRQEIPQASASDQDSYYQKFE